MKYIMLFLGLVLIGAGCANTPEATQPVTETTKPEVETSSFVDPDEIIPDDTLVAFPIDDYVERRTFKAFGEYIEDRFTGYHVGDDVEYTGVSEQIVVFAIADGEIVEKRDFVSGYGGFMRIKHTVGDDEIMAIYGHLDFGNIPLDVGDNVTKGQQIAYLGEKGPATDNERKHLHFALYRGGERRLQGYERSSSAVRNWLNPSAYFAERGLDTSGESRMFDESREPGEEFANLQFLVPEGMEVEYVPSIQALNIFAVNGPGSARERSQIFIRYFDASEFITLDTVTIFETEDLTVGEESYVARRYDIEKNEGVANFPDQPLWRNERHIVTDTRKEGGLTRYYVIAQNPELDDEVYEQFLSNIVIN